MADERDPRKVSRAQTRDAKGDKDRRILLSAAVKASPLGHRRALKLLAHFLATHLLGDDYDIQTARIASGHRDVRRRPLIEVPVLISLVNVALRVSPQVFSRRAVGQVTTIGPVGAE
jgi:hypothetical protein